MSRQNENECERRHEKYLDGPHPCHSQNDYRFRYPSDSKKPYTGHEDGYFVYIIVKDNNRTKAVQLRIKGNNNDTASVEKLFNKNRSKLNMLKNMQPTANVNEDTEHNIINITINFADDIGKKKAMVGLAEAWLAATGRLP